MASFRRNSQIRRWYMLLKFTNFLIPIAYPSRAMYSGKLDACQVGYRFSHSSLCFFLCFEALTTDLRSAFGVMGRVAVADRVPGR